MTSPVPPGLEERFVPYLMVDGAANPKRLGGTSVLLHQYVADVDTVVRRAADAGATVVQPPEDKFYGDRGALLEDPFGHLWSIHAHLRDLTPEEMQAAMEAMDG